MRKERDMTRLVSDASIVEERRLPPSRTRLDRDQQLQEDEIYRRENPSDMAELEEKEIGIVETKNFVFEWA